MESSSHITGDDGEGCNSSESGWTMYLASPMHGDDDGDGKASGGEGSHVEDGGSYSNGRRSGKEEEDEDDDSLASDASTGPAQVKVPSCIPDGKEGKCHQEKDDYKVSGGKAEVEEEEEDEKSSKFLTSFRKKAGKPEKGGRGKPSRKEHNKRGSCSSSRASFFW